MEYKVTNWGNFEDEKYIDIFHEGLIIVDKYVRDVPKVTRRMAMELSAEELNDKIADSNRLLDIALAKYRDENQEYIETEKGCTEAVINALRETGYHFSGEFHQDGTWGCPIVNDKYKCCFSFREWGDIMAQAFPDEDYSLQDKDGDTSNRYRKWAWYNPELYKEFKYPNGGIK